MNVTLKIELKQIPHDKIAELLEKIEELEVEYSEQVRDISVVRDTKVRRWLSTSDLDTSGFIAE